MRKLIISYLLVLLGNDRDLLVQRWIFDLHLEQETVELCFGQAIGAFVLNGVLGGQHHKGFGHRIGLAVDGHLALIGRVDHGVTKYLVEPQRRVLDDEIEARAGRRDRRDGRRGPG